MPAKNSVKIYEEGGYYHVYNRGVEKRTIFQDQQDYSVFISYLKFYLTLPKPDLKIFPTQVLRNFSNEITLLCYCLMPNHYHMLIKQNSRDGMTEFVRSFSTRYAMYFNRRYERVGALFQGKYKAVKVESEAQLVNLTHYIHRNPIDDEATWGSDPQVLTYKYSSIGNYLAKVKQSWVKPNEVLDLFSKSNPNLGYRNYVMDSVFEASWGSDP